MDGAKESGDDETAAQGKAKEPPSPTENDAAAQGPAKEPPSTTEDEENDEAPGHAQESDAATAKLRASLESAIEAGEPVFLPSGSTYAAFPLETYLGYGLMNQCDGGACRISLPRPSDGDARVFDGAASSQRHVSMPLATFLAVAVARDADADPDAAAVARTVPGFDDADAHDDLYACQLELAGSRAPAPPLREALAAGALACVPAWAAAARAAAEAALDGGEGDASLHAWLGASRGRGTTTAAHYDGYQNFMCVLSGRKTVELWPPGERALCASAPAWEHHARAAPPPPAAVFDVGPGDAAFWPEGWWHRVTSAPRTRAINVWWRGARHALVSLPAPLAPFALRTLAHRCAEAHLKTVVDAARGKRRRVEGVDPLLPAGRVRAAAAALGEAAWRDAVARFDDETCYLVDELHDDLDVFFPGPDAADARAAFDAKKDRYAADALAAVVRDITGTS